MKEYLDIYYTFLKIGAVNFGGGYAMLPLLEQQLVHRKQWCTKEDLLNYYAIGQCTPGIIAINVSTFIGYKKKKVFGALCSTLGFISVPLVLILCIASLITSYSHIPLVRHAFAGIRVCVFIFIIQAIQNLWKSSIVNKQTLAIYSVVLCLCVLGLFLPLSIPNALLVIGAGLFGIFFAKDGGSKNVD